MNINKFMDEIIGLSLIGVILAIAILAVIVTRYWDKDIYIFVLSLTGFSTAVMALAIFVQIRNQNIQLKLLKKQTIPSIRLLGYSVFAYLDGKYDLSAITEEEFNTEHNVKLPRIKRIKVMLNVMNESNAAVSISGAKLNEIQGTSLKKPIDYYLKTKAVITDNPPPTRSLFDFKLEDFAVHLTPTDKKRIFIELNLPEAIEVNNIGSAILLTIYGNFGEMKCGVMEIKEFRVMFYDEDRGGNRELEISKFLDEMNR